MKSIYFLLLLVLTISCGTKEPEPIKLNVDGCEYCKMKISDGQFGAELITSKGRVYKFDDMHCMVNYHQENSSVKVQAFYIHDFNQVSVLIPAETAFFVKGGEINSPMRGNIIAVQTEEEAKEKALLFNAKKISWNEIIK